MVNDCDILLSANRELEQLYYEQYDPCLALHISRNYHLLEAQDGSVAQQKQWHEKATIWWELYWGERVNVNKGMAILYDHESLLI